MTFIGKEFQLKTKIDAVFLDITAAYDTVWKQDLLLKAARILSCNATLRLISNILSVFDRSFRVILDDKRSTTRVQQNCLLQGSVVATVFFNLYISDIPKTNTREFIYADDIVIVVQNTSFTDKENQINTDLNIL